MDLPHSDAGFVQAYVGEIQENQTRRDQYIALISVYKAMGGGWSVSDSPLAAPTAKAKTNE